MLKQKNCKSSQYKHKLHFQGVSRTDTILELIPISRTTLWRWCQNGRFPKPIKLSPTITVWRNSEVLAWLDSFKSQQHQTGEEKSNETI